MAILPARIVEIEFDAGVWTDVTADFVSIATQRGRNRELGSFQAGNGTLVLRNESRKYDPEYAAGAYYGKLRPNRRIRLRATYSAVTYPVIVGYIDRIAQTYEGPNGAVTTVTFSDLFKILNRVELPRSVYTVEVAADLPELWYRLDEPVSATALANSGSLGHAYDAAVGTIGFTSVGLGNQGLTVRDGGSAGFADGTTHALSGLVPNDYGVGTASASFAIEAWVNITAHTSLETIFLQPGLGASADSVWFTMQASGKPGFIIHNTAGTAYAVETTAALAAGTHHLVARHDSDRSMHIFVDGIDVSIADLGVPGVTTGTIAKTPGPTFVPSWSGGAGLGAGAVDEIAVYRSAGASALSSARIAAHNSAGRTPWNGDTVAQRAGRILDLAGVAAGDRSLDTGSTSLQNTSLGGSGLAYLQKLEVTELGELFVTRDGKVRLLGRRESQQGAYLTSQATLADATPGAGEVGYRDVGFDVDEAVIIDRATVSRDGSVAVTYSDAAAIAEFQAIDATYDGLLHDSDAYSYDYAQWIVNTHRTPTSRVGAVEVALPGDPANAYPKMLGLEIGDRVTLKRRPKVGAAITYDYRVEAIAHDTGGAYWNTHLQLSPFNLGAGGNPVWIWGTTKWGQQVWGI